MWHEARKQEKKLREAMVNYQKRAERRKEHYDKLRGDPHQLLRVHGNKCKLHLDPKTASTLDSTMIPWQGDPSHIISQYDVRIHLDYIPDYSKLPEHKMTKEEKLEESRCDYERYRVLVKNAFHGLSESDALAKINVDEMYPEPSKKTSKKPKSGGSAIGYSYDDDGDSKGGGSYMVRPDDDSEEKNFSGESDYEVDMDVDSFNTYEVDKLNVIALDYSMPAGAFSKSLRAEKSELLEQKMLKLAELEKSAISGKMSRRERRTWKESQQQIGPQLDNVPSYTVRGSPTYDPYEDDGNRSRSRSTSPEFEGKVEYITEFGGNEDQDVATAPSTTSSASRKVTTATTTQPPSKSLSSSSRAEKKLSREDKHGRSSRRGDSYDDSPRRKKRRRRRSSSDREEYRSGYGGYRRGDRYSPERRRSRSPRDRRSGRHRNSSRSRSRDRYSRRYRNDSYSRSRSRSRGHNRYRDRSRERSRYDDRRRRHYSSSSRSSSSSSRDSRRPSRYHTKRKRSSSRDSLRSWSGSVDRNDPKKKLDTRSKSRSLTPGLPALQPLSNFIREPSPPLALSPPPVPSPPRLPGPQQEEAPQDSNDESSASKPPKSVTKTSGKSKISHRERLMKKMQAQLNKQHKMDKKAVKIKEKKRKAQQMEREDLLREQQRKLKETQREELKEESYIYSGQAETYKLKSDSDRSSSPDSPTRLLMLGGRTNKNNKGPSKDNGQMISI